MVLKLGSICSPSLSLSLIEIFVCLVICELFDMHGINDDFNGNADKNRHYKKKIEAFRAHYAPFCSNI